MSKLYIFDTSNFRDYPVGGQVTSIKNFMRYIGEYYPQNSENIVLVGVSVKKEDIGKIQNIQTEAGKVKFLAKRLTIFLTCSQAPRITATPLTLWITA